tara:strand:+ start:467 stop:1570 length:1104 start_codon:yes stop_codon:yes gene_type:complete
VIVYQQIRNTRVCLFRVETTPDVSVSWESTCEFLKIAFGKDVDHIPKPVKNMCDAVGLDDWSFWPTLLPAQTREQIIADRKADLLNAVSHTGNYIETWLKIRSFLDNLGTPDLDESMLRQAVPKNHKSLFEKIRKGDTKPRYNTSGTSTGRLTITSGPNFLTLPRESRNALRATQKGSSIYSIDFTSLEPRVALWMSSTKHPEEDVYATVMEMCDISDRAVAKLATLSSLYGAGVQRLSVTIGSQKRAKQLIERVSNFFEIPECAKRLEHQAANGCVVNYFGRPLFEATKQPRVRVNHYIQSTAADLANLLFAELCKNNKEVTPLVLIHDALIAEVPDESAVQFFDHCKNISYDGFDFPTKIERMNI